MPEISNFSNSKIAAIFEDRKSVNTQGGSYTGGTLIERTLQTVAVKVGDDIFTLASNRITISRTGKYYVRALCPAYEVDGFKAFFFRNSLAQPTGVFGTSSGTASGAVNAVVNSVVEGFFDHTNLSDYYSVYMQGMTTQATNGLGVASGQETECYTRVYIERIGDV